MTHTRPSSLGRLALATTCVAVIAAGCGSDDDAESSGATGSDTAAGDTAADPATATSPAPSDTSASGPATSGAAAGTGSTGGDEACRSETLDEVVPKAQEEGKVTIYSSQGDEQLDELAAAFEEEYPGVDAEVVRDVDSTAIARVETEMQTGSVTADFVVSAAPGWVTEKAPEGWFVAPTGPQFTCESDYDTDTYVHDGNFFEVSAVVFSFAWNTDLYPDGVDSYEALLDPALAGGKIGVVDPAIAPVLADYYHWLDATFDDGYVDSLAGQEPRIYPGGGANQEALVAGEIMASSYIAPVPELDEAIADGAPIEYGVPDEAWGAKFYGTILDGAPHPNAAQLFADFMVTAAGQELIHSGGTVLPGIEGSLTTVDQIADIDLEAQQPEQVTAFLDEWNGIFR